MALDGKINNSSEVVSAKNGIAKHNGTDKDHFEKVENTINTAPIASHTNQTDKVLHHADKSEKDLNSYIDFIKTIRQELDCNNSNENRNKVKSCASLTKTIDCDNKIYEAPNVETQHKVTFCDDSKIINKQEDKCKAGKKNRRQTISVSGEKNAQLICIRDEDSIIEDPEEEKITKNRNEDSNYTNSKFHNNAEPMKHKQKKEVIKISRLPKKSLNLLKLLPNGTMYNVIKYKISFKKFSRQNPMYQKSPTIQPWEIVDLIADHLLNDLLLGVAKEIEENDIVKNLYESEFC